MHVYLKRADGYYFYLLELPGIMITLLSFTVFFLDVSATGERLGFGSTMMLTMLVLSLIASDKTPVCGETLWIGLLLQINIFFSLASVLQSCFVTYVCFAGTGKTDEALAEKYDWLARRTIPPLYLTSLGFLYQVRFDDGYTLTPSSTSFHLQSFQGIAPLSRITNVGSALAVPLTLCGLALVWVVARRAKLAKHMRSICIPVAGSAPSTALPASGSFLHRRRVARAGPQKKGVGDGNAVV